MLGITILQNVVTFSAGVILTGILLISHNEAKVLKVKNELAEVKLQAANERSEALDFQILNMESTFADYQKALQENQHASLAVLESITVLRTDTVRMRNDFNRLPDRLATATQPVIAEYATACTTVLTDVVEAGNRLARLGSEIAAKADGHAADVRLLR